MSGIIRWAAYLVAGGLGACSLVATGTFGLLFAPGPERFLFAGIFGLLDMCKFLLPTLGAISFAGGSKKTGLLCWAMYFVMATVSVGSHIGLYATLKGEVLGGSEAAKATYAEARATGAALEADLAALGTVPPLGTIESQLASKRLDARYSRSKGCTSVSVDDSRALCNEIASLEGQAVNARAAEKIKAKLEEAEARLRGLSVASAFVAADPQAAQLSKLTGLSEDDVRLCLSVIIALVMEMGSSLLLNVTAAVKKVEKPARSTIEIQAGPLLGQNFGPTGTRVGHHNENSDLPLAFAEQKEAQDAVILSFKKPSPKDVAQLAAQGLSQRAIAEKLNTSRATVRRLLAQA